MQDWTVEDFREESGQLSVKVVAIKGIVEGVILFLPMFWPKFQDGFKNKQYS